MHLAKRRCNVSNILILGAGRVGATVAEQLVFEHHNVTIVDDNPANLKPLSSRLDLRAVQARPSTRRSCARLAPKTPSYYWPSPPPMS